MVGPPTDVATLAELLHETAEHHDQYEKTHAAHNWWDWYAAWWDWYAAWWDWYAAWWDWYLVDWYAAYIDAREHGSTPEPASDTAGRHIEEVLYVLPG